MRQLEAEERDQAAAGSAPLQEASMQALEHILYFADGEFGSTRAFRRAVALARHHGARLTLMDITIE
ncbi:hypothetical protein CKO40_20915 [Halochromatium glycolicum]|uniref:Universal stress protein n=1 Tax=Halochromatium glycolicum TaxID=85075 RepID=A0AAJ0U7Y8_9GAMM|nr:hypothetical protein [Halochromatium glycolicum]